MAMNKRERAEVDALRDERDKARAMRIPSYPIPKSLPLDPTLSKPLLGWCFSETRNQAVPAWTTTTVHGDGHEPNARPFASRGALVLFATEREALMALRLALTDRYAERLAALDRLIEAGDPDHG